MRERFDKTIFTNGRVGLAIRTPEDIKSESCGHYLLPLGETLEEKEITPVLLRMLSEAYHAGYLAAVNDGQNAVKRLVYENKAHRKPAPKISEVMDFRD